MSAYLIGLKDKKTGEVKEILDEILKYPDNDEGKEYIWTEGNFGCNCNRYDYFYPEENVHYPCVDEDFRGDHTDGSGDRFELLYIKNRETGKILVDNRK